MLTHMIGTCGGGEVDDCTLAPLAVALIAPLFLPLSALVVLSPPLFRLSLSPRPRILGRMALGQSPPPSSAPPSPAGGSWGRARRTRAIGSKARAIGSKARARAMATVGLAGPPPPPPSSLRASARQRRAAQSGARPRLTPPLALLACLSRSRALLAPRSPRCRTTPLSPRSARAPQARGGARFRGREARG